MQEILEYIKIHKSLEESSIPRRDCIILSNFAYFHARSISYGFRRLGVSCFCFTIQYTHIGGPFDILGGGGGGGLSSLKISQLPHWNCLTHCFLYLGLV